MSAKDREIVRDLIKNKTKGHFFGVDYYKKDGSKRHLTGHPNVKKHLKGGKSTLGDQEHIEVVWDTVKRDYRSVDLDTVERIQVNGVTYYFEPEIKKTEET